MPEPAPPSGTARSRRRERRADREIETPVGEIETPADDVGGPTGDVESRPSAPDPADHPSPPPRARRSRRDPHERQWRELAGAGHTELTLGAALRSRDASRPTGADLAEAERDVVVAHRHWQAREQSPEGRSPGA